MFKILNKKIIKYNFFVNKNEKYVLLLKLLSHNFVTYAKYNYLLIKCMYCMHSFINRYLLIK